MNRAFTIAFIALTGATFSASALAADVPPGADDATASTDTVLAMSRPPGRYYPGRRVYRYPRYVARPRRAVEAPRRPQFEVGLGVHGTSVINDGDNYGSIATGGGFELMLGWRPISAFALDMSLWLSFHDANRDYSSANATLGALSVDGRFFLTDWNQRLQPYLQVGIGAYAMESDAFYSDSLGGPGFNLGGGIDFYLTRNISIGGKLLYRGAWVDNTDSSYYDDPYESAFLSSFQYGGDVKFHF
ncbi:MAG: outer membrane beta-barrel protein [Myxococcales bacterium]|nr:outer membrane beta-barrel protein [Myxococcales bacterium]MCB9732900.1 outer membrane beta-barrel protein [Deltaproteobacteria bacterium]